MEHRVPARDRRSHQRMKGTRAGKSTPERILDAAEKLFSRSGFDAVSLRMITGEAGVELALANYHFGPKTELFRAVVRRRAEALNEARREALDALDARAPVEAVIAAFTGPFLDKCVNGGPGWKHYGRLIAHIANSPRWTTEVMSAEFDPVARDFIARVRERYPEAAEADVYWAFHFLIGTVTITFAETGRIDRLSGGVCRAADLETIHDRLVPFVGAGFRALCERGASREA